MATLPTTDKRRAPRGVGPLTERGLIVAHTYRLRQVVETLPAGLQRDLLADLRDLLDRYTRPRRGSAV